MRRYVRVEVIMERSELSLLQMFYGIKYKLNFLFLFYYFWYNTTTFPDLLNKNNNNM